MLGEREWKVEEAGLYPYSYTGTPTVKYRKKTNI